MTQDSTRDGSARDDSARDGSASDDALDVHEAPRYYL